MTNLESVIAVLNDEMKLNNKQTVHLLLDVLREVGPDTSARSVYSELNKIEQNENTPQSKLAGKALTHLGESEIEQYDKYLDHLKNEGIEFVHLFQDGYPDELWDLDDQPLGLYIDGDFYRQSANIAVVGTRDASDERVEKCSELAEQLADQKYTIVSGLALGIDTAAHRGALNGNGDTIAVLPGHIQQILPKSNNDLAEEIRNSGALISEQSYFESMHKGRYLERNRITAGISDAIVVAASGDTGGTIRQAEIAQEQNLPRFYFDPGWSDGFSPNKLRNMGLIPFETAEELIELIQNRHEHFDMSRTSRMTLSEF